jgi:hypothetical protein
VSPPKVQTRGTEYARPDLATVAPAADIRQLHFSKDETKLSLDAALFINGLPIAPLELKNSLTKQMVEGV